MTQWWSQSIYFPGTFALSLPHFQILSLGPCPFFVSLRALGFLTLHQPTASLFFINQPLPYSSPTKLHLFLIMVQSASSKSKAPHVKTGPPTKKPHNKKSVHNGKCSCSWVLMNLISNIYRWECRSCLEKHANTSQSEFVSLNSLSLSYCCAQMTNYMCIMLNNWKTAR